MEGGERESEGGREGGRERCVLSFKILSLVCVALHIM